MSLGLSGTVGDAGEFAVVDAVAARFAQGAHVDVGPGDDAAVVAVPGGEVVASLDMLVQNRHFRLDWSNADDVGHKAAAENLSDINAMGGTATALLVGLGAPAELATSWALQFADGLAAEASEVGASVVGGDLTAADLVTVAITALGICEHGVVRRSGARPGDVVALAGRVGWAAAGFAVLARGFRSPRAVVEAHRQPHPPYGAGPQAARLGATAMIDVSDGLLQDLGHIAAASSVAIDVSSQRLEVADPLRAVGAALGVDPMSFVLTGGDDYCLAATFPPGTELPAEWREIGAVTETGEPGSVTVDGAEYEQPGGHQHFR
jgi:thiamine-monophosphate kinase